MLVEMLCHVFSGVCAIFFFYILLLRKENREAWRDFKTTLKEISRNIYKSVVFPSSKLRLDFFHSKVIFVQNGIELAQ